MSASHKAGQWQDVTVAGDFSHAQEIDVTFFNDAWGGTSSTDRNLYVASLSVNDEQFAGLSATNGASAGYPSSDPNAAALYVSGILAFHVADAPPPPVSPPPPSSGGLTLHVSGDAWQGDPQFIVSVDGKQVGGPNDVSASHGLGQWQDIAVAGDFSHAQEIDVTFVNDAWGGTSSTDRNLYVASLSVNGEQFAGLSATNGASAGYSSSDPNAAALYMSGTLAFHVADAPPVPPTSGVPTIPKHRWYREYEPSSKR